MERLIQPALIVEPYQDRGAVDSASAVVEPYQDRGAVDSVSADCGAVSGP
jgi:hypothetical protein